MAILKELKLKNIYLIIPAVFAVLIVFFAAQEDEEIPELSIEQSSINLEVPIEKNKHSSFYTVEEGDSMSVIFEENKVPLNLTYRILRGPHKNDFANLMPGNEFEFHFLDNELLRIELRKGPLFFLSVLNSNEPEYELINLEPEMIREFKSGKIISSFYEAALESGIPDSVIMDLAYLFGWDIDFIFDIREGDSFKVLYETPYAEGAKIDNGDILYAEFINQEQEYTAIRYYARSGEKFYFDKDGNSLRKAFLRAPLDFAYVSSHFNPRRKHPILNKIRAHNGVDYAAKRNTPVRSTGDGVIIHQGWKSGYGRTIQIRHGGEITTLYAHLESYNKKLGEGSKVNQGTVIGYVGDSGLATAPHLHYEFKVGDKRTDPLKVRLPDDKPIDKMELPKFNQTKSQILDLTKKLSIMIADAN
jgi:murein DD-endopeptidase MepM/ murein hydrolase activator NlpD